MGNKWDDLMFGHFKYGDDHFKCKCQRVEADDDNKHCCKRKNDVDDYYYKHGKCCGSRRSRREDAANNDGCKVKLFIDCN